MDDGKVKAGRQSQVYEQLECMDKELARAADIQNDLRDRLACASTVPEVRLDGEGPDQELVPLAATLRNQVRRIRNMTDEYECMIRRIEL